MINIEIKSKNNVAKDAIIDLQEALAPIPRKNVSLNEQTQPVDLLGMNLLEFNNLIDKFESIFKDEVFPNFGLQTYGPDLNQIRELHLTSIWLYMSLSIYIHNSVDMNNDIDKAKLEKIQWLDAKFHPFIQQAIMNINSTEFYHYDSNRNHSIYYHQKMLMVDGNLFAFMHNLLNNPFVENKENLTGHFPLSIDWNKKESSRKQATNRRKKKEEKSQSEQSVTEILRIRLANSSPIFRPKGSVEGNQEQTVDYNTGLELDFPLCGIVAIEVDSPFHFIRDTKNHTVIHKMKSSLLRESGKIRLSVYGKDEDTIEKILWFFSLPKVEEYVEEYNNLIELRYHVRQDILITRDEINRCYEENDFDNVEAYKKTMAELLTIDRNICECVNGDHLEKLLQNQTIVDINIQQIKDFYMERNKFRRAIGEIDNAIRVRENKIEEIRKAIEYIPLKLKDAENVMESEIEIMKKESASLHEKDIKQRGILDKYSKELGTLEQQYEILLSQFNDVNFNGNKNDLKNQMTENRKRHQVVSKYCLKAKDAIKEIDEREHQVTMKQMNVVHQYGEAKKKAIKLQEDCELEILQLREEIVKIKKENDSSKEQMMIDVEDNQNSINNRIDSVVSQLPIGDMKEAYGKLKMGYEECKESLNTLSKKKRYYESFVSEDKSHKNENRTSRDDRRNQNNKGKNENRRSQSPFQGSYHNNKKRSRSKTPPPPSGNGPSNTVRETKKKRTN